VAETREQRPEELEKIMREIIENITTAIGDPPDKVLLVPPKSIPKTSSGKLQRSSTKSLYQQGKLAKRQTPTWLQFLKLFVLGGIKRASQYSAKLLKALYTIYACLIVMITLLPTWIALWFIPKNAARKATQFWTRNVLRLMGCPLYVKGEKHFHVDQPMIYVSNHMSYIDTLVLTSILPPDILIVAKKELSKVPIIRKFIKKLGHLTVDRVDFLESMLDTNFILTKLLEGGSILLFPEGTFSYAAGVRPFKLGAFKMATETDSPICPIAIKGTRQILRGSRLLLKPHRIDVWIGKPILPRSKDWREATRLRTVTRMEIAKHCGEHLLDVVSTVPARE
jgi:fatty-acyl-CoA synthase